ncbi:hypothetical protein GQ600_18675 [Phytophthora cactorum]|nr:hypothetical protein GQ600_18675 [Phytophthora cactorum]
MLRVIPLLLVAFRSVHAVTMEAVKIFSGANCAGTPDVLAMYNVSASCAVDACSDINFGNDTYYISRACNISDRFAHTEQVFGDFTYVIMETYDNKSCTSFGEADVFLASGGCEISSGFGDQSAITSLFSNGSAVVELYPDNACGGEPSLYFELDKAALSTGSCQQDLYKFYSSESVSGQVGGSTSGSTNGASASVNDDSDSSSIGVGAIVGIAVAAVVVVLIVALLVVHRIRKNREAEMEENDTFNDFRSPQSGQKNASLTDPGSLETISLHGHSESPKPLSLVGSLPQLVVLLVAIIIYVTFPAVAMDAMQVFSRGECVGTPNTLIMMNSEGCEDSTCKRRDFGDNRTMSLSIARYLTASFTPLRSLATSCQIASIKGTSSVIVDLYTNGSVDVFFFEGDGCGVKSKSSFNFTLSGAEVENGDCVKEGSRYTPATASVLPAPQARVTLRSHNSGGMSLAQAVPLPAQWQRRLSDDHNLWGFRSERRGDYRHRRRSDFAVFAHCYWVSMVSPSSEENKRSTFEWK